MIQTATQKVFGRALAHESLKFSPMGMKGLSVSPSVHVHMYLFSRFRRYSTIGYMKCPLGAGDGACYHMSL